MEFGQKSRAFKVADKEGMVNKEMSTIKKKSNTLL
jgi:hypothetical protein